MIEDFVGVKNSLRNLSDDDFQSILPTLASELEQVSYQFQYTDAELRKDWTKLCSYASSNDTTSSRRRPGMKLCEQFFPNIFDVKNIRGISFADCWTSEKLERVLVWNRKSHSTPYMSELRRGVCFCSALIKNTMYRPHLAKSICSSYKGAVVLDPSFGWGGRMLGTVASGMHYVGFDPNPVTYNNLMSMIDFLGIENSVTIFNVGSEHMNQYDFPECDIILTSPPYFNYEIYHDSPDQSENQYSSYSVWRDKWLAHVVQLSIERGSKDVKSCWNVHDLGDMKMIGDVEAIHSQLGFECTREFSLSSPSRPNKSAAFKSNSKSIDLTRVYESVDRDREEIIAWW